MARPSLEAFLKFNVRKVEKADALLAWRTQVIRDHATDYGWDKDLVNSLKIVDDGTGHRVAMNSTEDLDAARNIEYSMPGKPAKPVITTFHYGLGEF